jgi:hypothetical protein
VAALAGAATTLLVRSAVPHFVLLPVLFTTSCVRQTTREFETDVAQLPSDSARESSEIREVVVGAARPEQPAEGPTTGQNASQTRLLPPEPALFRLGAGYGALGQIDLAPCRNQGLSPGYLRVRVTFQHNGRVARAAVESVVAPPTEALACIGEQLEAAMVPVFDGIDVTLSKSFFVN